MIEENNISNTTVETVQPVESSIPAQPDATNVENINQETGEVQGVDFVPGPGDIVIEEDFDIDLEVKPVSEANITSVATTTAVAEPEPVKELGTEQTGNITF